MTCHTKQDRATLPPRAIDQRIGVREAFHEGMNYDGQYKSIQQETNDTMVMLAMVLIFVVIIGFTALAIYLGVTWVGS